MTHGVGSCSGGGGGGGFSGGGFSGGYTHYHCSSSRNGRNSECDPECQRCCSAAVTGFGALLCLFFFCRNQNRKRRLGIMWFWIIVFSTCAAFSVAFGTYGRNVYSTSPSDMRQVRDKISPSFCTGIELSSPSTFSAYRLAGNPTIGSRRQTFNFTKDTEIDEDTYEFWGFYLLANSNVNIKSCVRNSLNLYIIKGEDNLKRWIDDNYCIGCYEKRYYTGSCYMAPDRYTYTARTEDEYYFVFANHGIQDTSALVTFTVDRSLYNLNESTQLCENTKLCKLYYSDMDSAETFVYDVAASDLDDAEMYTSCIRRDWVFLLIFLLAPIVIGFLGTVFIFRFYKEKGPPLTSANAGLTNSGLTEPINTATNYHTIYAQPPSYQEAVKN